jgi:hypothetical protein
MARTQRLIRIATALAFICLLFANGNAHAENAGGISATYFIITDAPPSKDLTQHTFCGRETENNINRSFDGEPFTPCPDDLFLVHYTGFITLPAHSTIQFWLAADDGGTMKIGTYEWGDWSDKGCGAIETEPMTMPSQQPLMLDGWFYENGGGTCFMLAWKIDDGDWEIVPDSAFTLSNQIETTTTTTQPATTTTQRQVTTTSVPTSNRQEDSPATVPVQVPVTTDTTATTVPAVVPQTTVAVVLEPTQPATTLASSVPVATVPAPSTSDAQTTTTLLPTTTQPIQEPTSEPQSVSEEQIIELLDNLDLSTPEEVVAQVATILEAELDSTLATQLATNSELLEVITPDQAEEIFASLDLDTLDPTQIDALVETVQNAPEEIREAFETAVNVFDGAVDSYVPVGSSVPISTRRLVIAASALLSAVPVAPSRRN